MPSGLDADPRLEPAQSDEVEELRARMCETEPATGMAAREGELRQHLDRGQLRVDEVAAIRRQRLARDGGLETALHDGRHLGSLDPTRQPNHREGRSGRRS